MGTRHTHGPQGQGVFKIVLVLVLGALSFLSHAWLRMKVVTTSFEVEQSRKARARLENEYVELKSIHESRMSASRLERLRERLADQGELFVEARPEQIIFLPEAETAMLVGKEDLR